MKLSAVVTLTTAIISAPLASVAQPKTQVMIVGMAHLVAKRDVHNSQFQDSPLSAKRQTQVADVVNRLAQFHPTKVLVEVTYGNRVYPQHYREYLAGKYTLGADEVYQFGFKLAAGAGNQTIYPIDTFGPSLIDDNSASGKRMNAYLEANFTKISDPVFDVFLARSNTLEKSGTYLELLRYINSDTAIRANASFYSILDGMGRGSDNAGSTYVSQWYARNAFIFSNLLSVVKPGDRVVVFMGQGHEYLLREFVRLNPNLADVDPLKYLNR